MHRETQEIREIDYWLEGGIRKNSEYVGVSLTMLALKLEGRKKGKKRDKEREADLKEWQKELRKKEWFIK